ncbi:zinc finger protein 346 [Fundulus heteroclitus]|uniref:zinc finger protein 346 n=1 Tax=Fundulus heteroclitus TaxID=8078 RepID=UPI00165A8E40|nr:zinc finger protein 346 [Fundulus heteroclitus]
MPRLRSFAAHALLHGDAVCRKIMAEAMQTDTFPILPSGPAEVDKMIKERSDLFSDTQCKVCNAVLISQSQKLTHYQSKKHANKVRRFLSLDSENGSAVKKAKTSDNDCNNGDTERLRACHLCNMTFTSPVMAESHYQGKFHAKKLKIKAIESQTPEASQLAEKPVNNSGGVTEADNNNNPDRFCSTCKAIFNNPLMAQQHYAGKKHKKHMTRLKLMETYGPSTAPASTLNGYPCVVCNIVLNSVEQYQSHISGARHKNQVKKTGQKSAEDRPSAVESRGADEQCAAADDQYAAGDEECAGGDDQYTSTNDQYPPGDDDYIPPDDQYGSGDGQFGNHQYTPEFSAFSEQFQYT